ncbi:MAG: SWIM zinc finger family protein [Acidithiobacillus sp.]
MSLTHTCALVEALAKDPLIISRMLNRELDPAVLEQAQSLGIAVFPAHWKDLSMRCSCPDWAVPCKHIAAVIYLVSREIDGNPFLVFSLKGVDLIEALRERHIIISKEAQAALPSIAGRSLGKYIAATAMDRCVEGTLHLPYVEPFLYFLSNSYECL